MSTAIAAPSAAPEAVPSTYGSASGLRSRPWNVAPATASPVPTTIAVRTRGSRRSMTIASAVGGHVTGTSKPMPVERGCRWSSTAAGPPTRGRSPRRTRRPARRSRRRPATPSGSPGGPVTRDGEPPGGAGGDRGGGHRGSATSAGRHGAAEAEADGAADDADGSTRSGWIASARASMPSPSRGPGRVTTTSSIGRTSPFLTAVSVVPAGSLGDLLGRHAVGGVAQQDRPRDRRRGSSPPRSGTRRPCRW